VNKHEHFKVLCRVAKSTRDSEDIQRALRFGIEHGISASKIRGGLDD